MGTLTQMFDTVEGSERLMEQIRSEIHEGNHARARDRAVLLVKILDASPIPCCDICGIALLDDEIDSFGTCCSEDAPVLELRMKE